MGDGSRFRCASVLALLAIGVYTVELGAQQTAETRGPATWRPVVFAYGLQQAGDADLNPFGSTGRREVVQLMPSGRGLQGNFEISRMEVGDDGVEVLRKQGWYEIRGADIVFYFVDERGATGQIEVARYERGRICGVDRASGDVLRYDLIVPKDGEMPAPPPGAPLSDGGCPVRGGHAAGLL